MTSPRAIGVIMDGNRRWARGQGLPTLEGHRRGREKTKELLSWAQEAGIEEVTLYAFSTENWNRTPEEVGYLMDLFREAIAELTDESKKQDGRLLFIGQRDRMPEDVQEAMRTAEEETKDGSGLTLIIALSYGGRAEIIAAVNELLRAGKTAATEEDLEGAMWSAGLHEPDLIIRTGGEHRLSNFLTWQSVYSELYFTETMWPAFTKEEFSSILADYASRERRLGK